MRWNPYERYPGVSLFASMGRAPRRFRRQPDPADGEAFLAVAPTVPVRTVAVPYPLADANSALNSLRAGILTGAAVLTMG